MFSTIIESLVNHNPKTLLSHNGYTLSFYFRVERCPVNCKIQSGSKRKKFEVFNNFTTTVRCAMINIYGGETAL